jgi:tRNA(Ile2) C34 agmatinyltransferase TiaS
MLYVGLDDTDTLETPGTVQLARHLVARHVADWYGIFITRHQLLTDPRVPCTRRNGCVAIAFEPVGEQCVQSLTEQICRTMIDWCPEGSDPGLCVVAGEVPGEVVAFGRACQTQLMNQPQARNLAERHAIPLRGLGGTEDGVIGALAAVGLASTADDGRIVYLGKSAVDHYDVTGVRSVDELRRLGVDIVRRTDNGESVAAGCVEIGKRLRPNMRAGKVVLYVSPSAQPGVDWHAERVV